MSDFGDGFAIGLMDKLGTNISERYKKGEDYFDKQLELARTKGMEAKAQSQRLQTQGLSAAKQLMQVGVPKDIVMHIANQNPDDLGSYLQTVQELQTEAGADGLDEEFHRELFDVQGTLDTNETLEQLFKRIYTPLANNIKADPETFKADKKATIFATIMGYNAQSEAMDRLENTEIVDGQSAADLLRYNGEPNLGDSTVTLDAGIAGDTIRDIRAARKGAEDKQITIANRTAIVKDYEDRVAKYKLEYASELDSSAKDDPNFDPNVAQRKAARELLEIYPREALEDIDLINKHLMPVDEDEVEDAPEGLDAAPAEAGAEVAPETKSVVVQGNTLVKDNFNGTSVWTTKDGRTVTVNNDTTPSYLGLSKKRRQQPQVGPGRSAAPPIGD